MDGWTKSTFSGDSNCVEVMQYAGQVFVRDSKRQEGTVLIFTGPEWDAFIEGVKAGEFGKPRSEQWQPSTSRVSSVA